MVDHAEHLKDVFLAGISGQPMPQAPPDADSAALHRQRGEIYLKLAQLEIWLAEQEEAGLRPRPGELMGRPLPLRPLLLVDVAEHFLLDPLDAIG